MMTSILYYLNISGLFEGVENFLMTNFYELEKMC